MGPAKECYLYKFFSTRLICFSRESLCISNKFLKRSRNFKNFNFLKQIPGLEVFDISIPSGVYSDLENAGITESVLFSYNDVSLRWIALENWVYKLDFNVTEDDLDHDFMILTFNGLDTITEISLNDEILGTTDNMFTRYRFDVKQNLLNVRSKNFYSISLKPLNCIPGIKRAQSFVYITS